MMTMIVNVAKAQDITKMLSKSQKSIRESNQLGVCVCRATCSTDAVEIEPIYSFFPERPTNGASEFRQTDISSDQAAASHDLERSYRRKHPSRTCL
jgi:hypothetical protein